MSKKLHIDDSYCEDCEHFKDEDELWFAYCKKQNKEVNGSWMACQQFERKKQ